MSDSELQAMHAAIKAILTELNGGTKANVALSNLANKLSQQNDDLSQGIAVQIRELQRA